MYLAIKSYVKWILQLDIIDQKLVFDDFTAGISRNWSIAGNTSKNENTVNGNTNKENKRSVN